MRLFVPPSSARVTAIAVARQHPVLGGSALVALLLAVALITFLLRPFDSGAVQDPTISLDMVPSDNTYDDTTNTMTVVFNPNTDFCLASPTANPATHLHQGHLIIQNVEDLVGWQVRLNYDGGKMRPQSQNVTPFTDNTTTQGVGFTNLPIDQVSSLHRDLTAAAAIPPQAPGPQTALLGAVYNADANAAVSSDTPPKSTPDDTSYSAPNGGVLSQISLQVVSDQTGQTLYMDLSDDQPNPPGSVAVTFTGAGTETIALAETALGDGLHVEGGTCPPPTQPPTPSPTPTQGPGATPTPTPSAGGGPTACKCFKPELDSRYCQQGTGSIDDQMMTTSCAPDASPASHPDIVGSFDLGLGPDNQAGTPDDTGDYNFAGVVNLSPTVPDDNAVPVGAVLGRLGSQPIIGVVNNPCNNSQLRVPFTFMKGTTDINYTVEPRPFGETNDLAIMAGDNPPYSGQQDVKPAPAVTHYPSFLNAIFDPDWVDYGPDRIAGNGDDNNGPQPPIRPIFRVVGTTPIPSAGNLWVILQVLVFDKGTKLPNLPPFDPAYGYPEVTVLQQSSSASGSATPPAPSAVTDFCSPLRTVSVSYGVTHDNPDTPGNEGGIPVRTLLAAGTHITTFGYYTSLRDADGDGYENSLDTCPLTPDTVWNPRGPAEVGDSDTFFGFPAPDGIPDSCDPTPNEPTGGPLANQPTDHDGDGFLNRGDNCPLVANPDQRDTDRNGQGEEIGDGIGDACDPNPNTPDGAEIVCIKAGTVTSGGDPNVAYSPCQTELPPIIGGTPTPPPTPNYGPGSSHPLAASRVLDTRSGPSTDPIGKIGPERTLAVHVTGAGGVPASGVSAVVLNVTVTEPTEVSFLTVFPSPGSLPLTTVPFPSTSNLNFAAGQTIANLVIVPVGSDGNVVVYNRAGSVHVIFDVAGWFTGT